MESRSNRDAQALLTQQHPLLTFKSGSGTVRKYWWSYSITSTVIMMVGAIFFTDKWLSGKQSGDCFPTIFHQPYIYKYSRLKCQIIVERLIEAS